MNTNLKKILIILVIILILALIAFLVYNFVFKTPSEEEGGPGGFPAGEEGAPPAGGEEEEAATPSPELKIKSLSTERILAPALSTDRTKVIYYSAENGNVLQVSFDGSDATRISSAVLNNLVKIIWSPDKTKVISIYQDAAENITKNIYDYKTGKVSPLSAYIEEIAWSPNSDKIAYQYTNDATSENNISTANADGTKWQNIFQTRMKNVVLDWVGSEISFYEKPSGIAPGSLFLLNPLTKNLAKVLSDIYGLSVKWSPQKDRVLYSKTASGGKNISLYVAKKDGSNEANTAISTLAEKCVWSQDDRTIFCAIPKNINEAAILPDDFYKGLFTADDEFWKINLDTNEKTALLQSWERGNGIYDAVDLFLSPLEDYLFFVNKRDGLLYSIKL
jgi:hypothetical protein